MFIGKGKSEWMYGNSNYTTMAALVVASHKGAGI